ncbi:MAG: two-component sensor histidine kinase, partial [Phormidesmis sp. CAN_BIN44]|nr:two-component sensor histidine kinase [Phormidesmis sp. CAN_BIN44]
MNQSKLFRLTRLRFTAGYALVMGLAIGLGSLIVYEGIIAVHQKIVQQKLTSLAGVLHDSIEPALEQPGQLPAIAQQLAPGLCGQAIPCVQPNNPSGRHIAAVFQASDYYVRFLSQSGQALAEAGQQPKAIPSSSKDLFWQTVRDRQGDRYYQISWQLRTKDNLPWGYLQVGQSLQQWDEFLASIRLLLLFGLSFGMLLVGLVSWWLAGLAMQPIYRSYRQMQQFTS